MKNNFKVGIFGLLLGFTLSQLGFSEFEEMFKMFTLKSFRLIFVFLGAVLFSIPIFYILSKNYHFSKIYFHKGRILGGILFGIGWAITGSCPAIPFVYIGEGKFIAFITLAGIIAGTYVAKIIQNNHPSWKGTLVCGEE
ncbi:hypothetical protein BVX93_01480 [bacterium B13(2017)]|nr:hypothetical protein BVX93_01480 [bacterium B13(2017)]